MTSMHNTISTKNTHSALATFGALFFLFGFMTWINAILIPYFKIACQLSNFQAYLVTFAFYISYLLISVPSGYVLKKTGFKKGIVYGLCLMAFGMFIFIPAAYTRTYSIFLLGLFTIGSGLTILQSAANSYITIVGPRDRAAKRFSIMGICNKGAGMLAPLLFATVILRVNDSELFEQLSSMSPLAQGVVLDELIRRIVVPYLVMGSIVLAAAFLIHRSTLPDVNPEDDGEGAIHSRVKNSILQFPHLVLGAVAIFLHVGTQVIAIDTIIGYANSMNITLTEAKVFPSYTLLATITGYIIGVVLVPKYASQLNILKVCTLLGLLFSFMILFSQGSVYLFGHTADVSIWFIVLLGLANSMVWAGIWPLALSDLGSFTKIGASCMIMGLCGSAILPLVYGFLADKFDLRTAYIVLIPCYLYLIFYAFYGYKMRTWASLKMSGEVNMSKRATETK
jgi:FHS family L-fucose permease-like MFS transporter